MTLVIDIISTWRRQMPLKTTISFQSIPIPSIARFSICVMEGLGHGALMVDLVVVCGFGAFEGVGHAAVTTNTVVVGEVSVL